MYGLVGFTNYAIPTVLILLYLYILSRENVDKNRRILLNISLVILGFATALFVEHITIYIVAITMMLMIYQGIKYKKIPSKYITYFIGAALGAIVMFSNGAYTNIANNQDGYRQIPTNGIATIIEKISQNFQTIYKELILNNTILNIILVVLLLTVVYKFYKKNQLITIKKVFLNLSIFSIIGYALYMLIKLINPTWNIVLKYTPYFELMISVIFFLAIAAIIFICITEQKLKQKLLFYLISIGILTVPLFIVQPIGSRCFLTMYCMFILIVLELYNMCVEENEFIFQKVVTTGIIIFSIYLISVYGYIYKVNQERVNYLIEEASKGKKQIEIVTLPYEDYLWTSTPKENTIWEERIKLFYNIPKEIKLKNVTLQQWQKIKKD